MEHTYTLTCNGFIPPTFLRGRSLLDVQVTSPRSIQVDDVVLELLDEEPDLPIGATVSLWWSRWFHCETRDFIKLKQQRAEEARQRREEHEATVKAGAQAKYLHVTQAFLGQDPEPSSIKAHLDDMLADRGTHFATYRRLWRASGEDKQRSSDALFAVNAINDAIAAISTHLMRALEGLGVTGHVAYAYSPREGGSQGFYSPGMYHFMTGVSFKAGRYKRQSRDALCKTARNFWSLEAVNDSGDQVCCIPCLGRMITLLDKRDTVNLVPDD